MVTTMIRFKDWDMTVDDFRNGSSFYILKVSPSDAYHKYNLIGNSAKFINIVSFRETESYISVRLEMQDGIFAGEVLNFYRVKLCKHFPFEVLMREAIKI